MKSNKVIHHTGRDGNVFSDVETEIENLRTSSSYLTGRLRNVAGRAGGFEVWQRGTSVSVSASTTAYTADGWYLTAAANQASTVTQQAGLADGSVFSCRVARNSGQTGTGTMRFAMPLDTDEVHRLRGKCIVLSFSAQAGANWSPTSGTLTYTVYLGTGSVGKRNGSAYTGETTPVTGTVDLTAGASSAAQVISTTSSAIGSTVTCGEIQFNWAPTGTAGAADNITIDDVQVDIVPSGTTLSSVQVERIPIALAVVQCQRFYQVLSGLISTWGNGSSNATLTFPWPVTMRTAPTVTNSLSISPTTTNATATGVAFQFVGTVSAGSAASGSVTATSEI